MYCLIDPKKLEELAMRKTVIPGNREIREINRLTENVGAINRQLGQHLEIVHPESVHVSELTQNAELIGTMTDKLQRIACKAPDMTNGRREGTNLDLKRIQEKARGLQEKKAALIASQKEYNLALKELGAHINALHKTVNQRTR